MLSEATKTAKTVIARPTLAPQSVSNDIDMAFLQLNTIFNPLHGDFALDFHVSGAKDGYVYLSLALPEGMTRVFVQFLESMHSFFRFIDIKSRSAVAMRKAVEPSAIAEAQERQSAFRERVCQIYDQFRDQGLEVKEAVSRTNLALKAENSPWATYETVLGVLRGSGRFRKASLTRVPSSPQGGELSRAESVTPKTKGGPASSLGAGQVAAG